MERNGDIIRVETGTKTVDVELLAGMAELRERACRRLQKKGVPVVYDSQVLPVWPARIILREPYTVCLLGVLYGGRAVESVGVAKRNPIDRRNLSIGAPLAVYRAWRDFWVQVSAKDFGPVGVRVGLANGGPDGPAPEGPSEKPRTREEILAAARWKEIYATEPPAVVAETPF